MKIKARLVILSFQITILLIATYIATGKVLSSENWFLAGLFAVVINPMLLEPYYPRPADVIGNCLITLVLYFSVEKHFLSIGWDVFSIILIVCIFLALIAMIFGSQKEQTIYSSIARTANIIVNEATALRIFSIVFWLALIEKYPNFEHPIWVIGSAWFLIVVITLIDWKRIWSTLSTSTKNVSIEGIIDPCTFLISSTRQIPEEGKLVTLSTDLFTSEGIVLSRIHRKSDIIGRVMLFSPNNCEQILSSKVISLQEKDSVDQYIGSMEEGSSCNELVFYPTKRLTLGDVVSIIQGNTEVMYQITSVRVSQSAILGGNYLHSMCKASQIGVFNPENYRIEQFRWIPDFGTKLIGKKNEPVFDQDKIPESWFKLGDILGTKVPVFIDSDIASAGHMVVLGMTKMGKSTFAARYCNFLSDKKCVTILDQTGEYSSIKKIPLLIKGHLDNNGLAVCEPNDSIYPEFAEKFFNGVIQKAKVEYQNGQKISRIILIDEAHQFIPEPAIIGFNGPGKVASVNISQQIMQIRKFGISVILISQRTAVVSKSALSQCENIVAFKSVDKTGLEYLQSIIGESACDILPNLQQGEALVYGPAFSTDSPVVVKVDM